MISKKKVLQGARFFTPVVYACTKSLNKQGIQKYVYQNFQFFQPLKITFMWTCDFYRYEHVYVYKGRNFKSFLKENYAIALNSCYLFTKNC